MKTPRICLNTVLPDLIHHSIFFRKLRETSKSLQSEDMILLALQKLTDSLWPNGERAPPKEARKHELQMKEREEANRKLSTWLPGKEEVRMTNGQPRCTSILKFAFQTQLAIWSGGRMHGKVLGDSLPSYKTKDSINNSYIPC